jgi:hypothetical protein
VSRRIEHTMADLLTPRPLDDWHEDDGHALWWIFPLQECPYAGTPLDGDWPGYHTHWTPIPMPHDPVPGGQPVAEGGGG